MKKLALTLISTVTGATLIFGGSDLATRLRAGAEEIVEAVNDSSSTRHLIKVASSQLSDAKERLRHAEAAVIQHRERASRVENEVQRIGDSIEVAKTRLRTLQPAVSDGRAALVYSGCRYDKNEVKAEAKRLADFASAACQELDAREAHLKQLRRLLSGSNTELVKAREGFQTASNELRRIELELTLAEASAEAANAARSARESMLGELESGFGQTMAELQKRLAEAKADLALAPAALDSGSFDWQGGTSTDSLQAQINELLRTSDSDSETETNTAPSTTVAHTPTTW